MRNDFTAGMLVAKGVDAVNFSSVYDYVFSVFDIICHAFSDLDPGIFSSFLGSLAAGQVAGAACFADQDDVLRHTGFP